MMESDGSGCERGVVRERCMWWEWMRGDCGMRGREMIVVGLGEMHEVGEVEKCVAGE